MKTKYLYRKYKKGVLSQKAQIKQQLIDRYSDFVIDNIIVKRVNIKHKYRLRIIIKYLIKKALFRNFVHSYTFETMSKKTKGSVSLMELKVTTDEENYSQELAYENLTYEEKIKFDNFLMFANNELGGVQENYNQEMDESHEQVSSTIYFMINYGGKGVWYESERRL